MSASFYIRSSRFCILYIIAPYCTTIYLTTLSLTDDIRVLITNFNGELVNPLGHSIRFGLNISNEISGSDQSTTWIILTRSNESYADHTVSVSKDVTGNHTYLLYACSSGSCLLVARCAFRAPTLFSRPDAYDRNDHEFKNLTIPHLKVML